MGRRSAVRLAESRATLSVFLGAKPEPLIYLAKATGIYTFIDGAPAPGQIPLNLDALQADFYTGK